MRMPQSLRRFLGLVAIWTLLCLGSVLLCRFVLHWGSPYDYPAIHAWESFIDFHSFIDKFAYFHSVRFYLEPPMLCYPAPTAVAYKLFLTPQPHSARFVIFVYESVIVLLSLLVLLPFRSALIRRGLRPASANLFAFGIYLCSAPLWFDFSLGNIEFIVWIFLVLAIWTYRKNLIVLSAILIGIAGAMKIFPIIFVGLFIARKQYKALFAALLSAFMTTIAGLWLVDPHILESLRYTLKALEGFGNEYMKGVRPTEMGFDHSVLALIKRTIHYMPQPHSRGLILGYIAFAAIGGCLLFFLRIQKLPFINQLLCLTVAAIVLPPVSFEYTLIHLYAPLALIVFLILDYAKRRDVSLPPGITPALFLLAFLLSAQSEFIYHGLRYTAQFKCIALLALGYVACRYPFQPLDAENSGRTSAPAPL
jgi:hypothetical protein